MWVVAAAVVSTAPVLSVGAEIGASFSDGAPTVGIAATLAVPVAGPVALEIDGDAGGRFGPDAAPWGTGLAAARVGLGSGLSALAGVGGGWRDAPVAVGRVGLSYAPRGLPLRFGVTGELAGAPAAFATIELTHTLAPRPVPVAVAPVPVTAPVPEEKVWVPHPVCAWLPPEEAQILAEELSIELGAPPPRGSSPDPGAPPVTGPASLPDGTPSGAVVVVAYPGDRISVSGRAFPIEEDGSLVFGAPVGPILVHVEGGGRDADVEGAVATGYVIWLRAPDPRTLDLNLLGEALTADSLDAARAWIQRRGDHRVRLVGLHQDWEPAIVGQRRAEAIVGQLHALGLPDDGVASITTAVGAPGVRLESASELP